MTDASEFGRGMRLARISAGLSQEELAERAGLSARSVGELERGRVARPRMHSVRVLADALGLVGAARERFEEAARPNQTQTAIGHVWGVGDPACAAADGPAPGRASANLVTPAQLPAAVMDFAGRESYVEQLDRLLADSTAEASGAVLISAIAGMAGVGKTALAVHWAHRVRDRFGDGQLYVNLNGFGTSPPVRPIDALAQFITALGVPAARVPAEVAEAAALYRSLLAERRLLVILDNAGSVEQVRPLLPGAPGCMALITSRSRLTGLTAREGARRLTLDVLDPREAHDLLTTLLGTQRAGAEPRDVADLARACGYLPLALRIAAAQLIDEPRRAIRDHVAILNRDDALDGLALDDDPHAAVAAAFDASYARLAPAEQRMFRLLSLVPGTHVSSEAAAALAAIPVLDARHQLRRLVAAHLIEQRDDDRYSLHDLLRRYADRRCERDDSEAARGRSVARLLDWYLQSAHGASQLLYPHWLRLEVPAPLPGVTISGFPDHEFALAWFRSEGANVVAAITQFGGPSNPEATWRLAVAAQGFFWQSRRLIDWLEILNAGFASLKHYHDLRGLAALTYGAAVVDYCQDRHGRAIEQFTAAAGYAKEAGWTAAHSAAITGLGSAYILMGDHQAGVLRTREALALDRERCHVPGQARALIHLATYYAETGSIHQARRHAAEAKRLYELLASVQGVAMAVMSLGLAARVGGEFAEGLRHLDHALRLARQIGDRYVSVEALYHLGWIRLHVGQVTEARDLALAGLVESRQIADVNVEGRLLQLLGEVELAGGDHATAVHYLLCAADLAQRASARFDGTAVAIALAQACIERGDTDAGARTLREALRTCRELGYRLLESRALTVLAVLQLDMGDPEEAFRLAATAAEIHGEIENPLGHANALAAMGQAQCALGEAAWGEMLLAQASSIFRTLGIRAVRTRASLNQLR